MNSAVRKSLGNSEQPGTPVGASAHSDSLLKSGARDSVGMAAGLDATLVLRVLTGANQGAQVRMRAERMLVGNLESECDVVLDVGRSQRHACLIRASSDGWSVLAIAGDLWVGQDTVELQQSTSIVPNQVLTLGATAFCLGDPAVMDRTTLRIPNNLHQPAPVDNAAPVATPPEVPNTAEPHWHLAKRATGILAGLALLALLIGATFYLTPVLSKPSSTTDSSLRVSALRTVLHNQIWSQELSVKTDPDRSDRVLITGYLAERDQSKDLEALLSQQGLSAEHRWVSVAELSRDLSRRLELKSDSKLVYTKIGHFHMRTEYNAFSQYDRLVRRAMQDMPAILAFDIQLNDLDAADGGALSVHYQRVGAEVVVTGLDAIHPNTQYQVREVRLGALPSVVMSDGARYFEGASLPGNAVLQEIGGDHVIVQTAAQQRRIELNVNTPVLEKTSSHGAKGRADLK